MTQQSDFSHPNSLSELGWKPFFQQQLTLDDYEQGVTARVIANHGDQYLLATETGVIHLPHCKSLPELAVGDWLTLDQQHQFGRLLERRSQLRQHATNGKLIAANLDTAFIVCALNDEFNLPYIERYLAATKEAGIEPVVILTKADLCHETDVFREQVQRLDPFLMIEVVNALEDHSLSRLLPWCGQGRTIAFLGTANAGKSTLIEHLIVRDSSHPAVNQERPCLQRLNHGGLLIDSEEMHTFQASELAQELSSRFVDVERFAQNCRFSDCSHQNEPGCAIKRANKAGELDEGRVSHYSQFRHQLNANGNQAEQRAFSRQQERNFRSELEEKRKRRMTN